MYPYIELFGVTIYMTGVAVVSFILSFIFLVHFYCKRFNLNFWKFFNFLPVFLILPYLFGSYIYQFLNNFIIIPLNFDQLFSILSPYGYNFSFIGITIGIALSIYLFLRNTNLKIEKYKWIDVLFYSISLSIVPMGLFLLLGDDFIGKQVDYQGIGVSTFMKDSALYVYESVYPVGLFLSIMGLLSFMIVFSINFVFNKYGIGFLGFILLLLLFNIIFNYQNYDQHLVFNIFSYRLDIKYYRTIILSLLVGYWYYRLKNYE